MVSQIRGTRALFTNAQLSTMTLRHVIFHDVPNQRGVTETQVTLATEETPLDADRRRLLRTKLVNTLDSRSAYGIVFQPQPSSPIPALIRSYTAIHYQAARFVEISQHMATHLHQVQTGSVSPGLLCVIDITVTNQHGIILMKLEREEGAELEITHDRQKTLFEMSILDSLVLTGNTRLFKTAAFLRTGDADDDFGMAACDNQHSATDSREMARFWRRYLGCDLEEAARVTTSKFFSATMEFVNSHIEDPETRTVIYESLHSELRSAKPTVSTRAFLTNHVPEEVRHDLRVFLEERHVPMGSFQKDTQDIKGSLRRLTYISEAGVRIVAPEGRGELVRVDPEQIVVSDRLSTLGKA
jgi:hypothetical protein